MLGFRFFSDLDSVSQLFSARDTWTVLTIHTILLHQRLGQMLSVGYHLLVLLQRPQQQQEQQQHVLLRHQVLLPEQERHASRVAETARSVVRTPTTIRRF